MCDLVVDCKDGSDELYCTIPIIIHPNCQQIFGVSLTCDFQIEKNNDKKSIIIQNSNYLRYISIFGEITDKKLLSNSTELNVLIVEKSSLFFEESLIQFPNLFYLSLIDNDLTEKSFILRNAIKTLQILKLSYNPIKTLSFLNHLNSKYLKILDVSYSGLNFIEEKNFINTPYLENLKILKCNLIIIHKNSFIPLERLLELHLNNTKLPEKSFAFIAKNLKKIAKVYSEKYLLCCLFWEYINRRVVCHPKQSSFMTCSNMIGSDVKRSIHWLFGIVGCLLNVFSIFVLVLTRKFSKIYQLLLSLSDFGISAFTLSIAVVDIQYSGTYLENDIKWRHSHLCQTLGTIMTLALILQSTSMLLITVERYQAITEPLKRSSFLKFKKLITLAILMLCSILSCIPLLADKVFINLIFFKFIFHLCFL